MAIKRKSANATTKAVFSVGLNIVLTGSKRMSPEEQNALMQVSRVKVLIVDADDPTNILTDEVIEAKEFKTESVGYGLNIRDQSFSK